MKYYLGIDIGTSGTKAVCFDSHGKAIYESNKEYDLINPKPTYAEQNPLDWFMAVKSVIKDITDNGYIINSIGLSGQMHGLVLLDKHDNILRNSIIWCDNRAYNEAKQLENDLGNDFFKKVTGNNVVPSFTLSKLLWVKNNEPDIFNRIDKIMLPKDYIRYLLTNSFKTEYSDASGMQMLDIHNKCFSKEICDYLGISLKNLPELVESSDISGYIKNDLSEELGLSNDCFVVGGAGDQAAAAIGNGIVNIGDVSVVLGSSGVVFTPIDINGFDNDSLQVFMHAIPNTYHIMGVTNGCGLSYKWFKENIGDTFSYNELNEFASKSMASNNLIYLPYLNGERTPHMDPNASGTFIGIRQNTTKGDLVRGVLEGVAFSLKDCFSLLPDIDYKVYISGGGAKGDLWRTIISSILNLNVHRIEQSEGGALGVAILAMVADNVYNDIDEAVKAIIKTKDITKPNMDWVDIYHKKYQLYKKAYLSLKEYFKELV